MNEDNISMSCSALSFFALVGAFIFGGIAGNTKNPYYLLGVLAAIILIIIITYVKARLINIVNYRNFKEHWGNFQKRKRNFKSTQKFFTLARKKDSNFSIDDQTWADLNMDELFQLIDRTVTSPGEEMLYKILREPELKEEKLLERNRVIKLFKNNAEIRNKIGIELVRLGRMSDNGVYSIITKDFDVNYKYKYLFDFLALAFLVAVITIPIFKLKFIIIAGALFVINNLQHGKFKRDVESYINSLGYLNGIIHGAESISKINNDEIKHYTEILKRTSKSVSVIVKQTAGLQASNGLRDPVVDMLYSVFLIEERKFFSSINDIKKYRADLKELYKTLGELDALMSVASFREWIGAACTEPEFVSDENTIEAEKVYHPLVEKAVANSITLENKGIILTGTNMSGKSTFLRTIGVNALLAQTIYTCTAESYKTSFFKIMTSISPEDNISSGKSYYFREAEALKRIINECGDEPVLCIVDEIFRGTNPVERVNAAAEILNYISRHNTLTLVATHDLELTEILKDKYLCYYFTEDINEEGLKFDYKIKEGVCKNRNAIKLLKYLEYPEEIIQKTNERLLKI
ncbi:MutS-related protein [Clostridium guangxiense]|uniref:MutS-related protein n=2 Tax=Clostridium TaxID=1485 RepID=UPI001E5234E0|nr:MutS family DNA mismatch repair protein [Clostridium guangxiense]MCD2346360.1 MutS family DNA mismatch repair protein [Clostridium guangxiense]